MTTILVVDDDPDLRTLLQVCLEAEGFTVATACNGRDALARLRALRPEVILLDLMMPVMDGEAFRRWQQNEPAFAQIPVVCLSAKHDARVAASRLGLADCLVKPFDIDAVIAAVRRYCDPAPSPGSASRPA